MEKIIDLITAKLKEAFMKAGFPGEQVAATISNRPDLCEYQCNSAMILAKKMKIAPFEIAQVVVEHLQSCMTFAKAEAVAPGFINLDISPVFLADYLNRMVREDNFGATQEEEPKKIIIDYGGANVAKPLHIGHLRAAIIGESIKRICKYAGNQVLGDVHLGDWGLQMGQVIAEVEERGLGLDFDVTTLEEIYPTASKKCKKTIKGDDGEKKIPNPVYDETFVKKAHNITAKLQKGDQEYRRIWKYVLDISREDLKKNYDSLDVHFELWKGESDVQGIIPDMVRRLKQEGFAYESEGAWVVDVAQDSDRKKFPPCIIVKSDGSSLYSTTDLATLVERQKEYEPDCIIYVVDKRQSLHFQQVFRVAKMTGIVPEEMDLIHLGFGTMNGKDGKPYKTREGGVMRLESLIREINEAVFAKTKSNTEIPEKELTVISRMIALAALKYGDLSNQVAKDYIFDISRFIEFEGNTGPYILYTIVRIKSILAHADNNCEHIIIPPEEKVQKDLMIEIGKYNEVFEAAYRELAPHRICAYIYRLSDVFNVFYNKIRIMSEPDPVKKNSYLSLLNLTKCILEECIYLLGFEAPERM